MNTNLGKSSRVLSGMMKRWVHIPKSIIRYHTIYHRIIVVCIAKSMRENGCYLISQNLPQNMVDIRLSQYLPQNTVDIWLSQNLPQNMVDIRLSQYLPQNTVDIWLSQNLPQNIVDIWYHQINQRIWWISCITKSISKYCCWLVTQKLPQTLVVVWYCKI